MPVSMAAQAHLALDDEDGPRALGGQRGGGADDLVDPSVRGAANAPSSGVLPRWASTFRISAWKTTMMPKTR